MWKNIEYFSVAVNDIDEGIKLYQSMFDLKPMGPIKDDVRFGFRSIILGNGQRPFVEIIEPADPDSALARFMKGRVRPDNPQGEGAYLLGIEVDDLEAAVKRIISHGGRVTREADIPDMAWVHPLSAKHVFLELRQSKDRKS